MYLTLCIGYGYVSGMGMHGYGYVLNEIVLRIENSRFQTLQCSIFNKLSSASTKNIPLLCIKYKSCA